MTTFDGSGKEVFLKTLWEKEKLLVQAISPYPTMFSTLSKTEITIFVTFNLFSTNAFNLVWSKILSCWKGLTHYQTMPHFDTVKISAAEKHCEKRRNCLLQATSPFPTIFSTLHGTHFSFWKVICNLFKNSLPHNPDFYRPCG